MRLIDIKRLVNTAYDNFVPKFSNNTSGSIYYIENALALKEAIRCLYTAGIIERSPDLTTDIFTIIDSSMTDRIIADSGQIAIYQREISKLQGVIQILNDWLNRYAPDEEDESTINIKLPQLYKMEDLIKASSIINKALSQSVAEIGGEVKIKHLEYGSSWIIISVGVIAAVKLIMRITDAAFKITQKYYGARMMQLQYELLGLTTDMIKTIKEANEKIIVTESRKYAEEIENDFHKESDNERVERLRVSIAEMAKLIELGGEIHPSLIEASNTQTQAPDYKSLLGIIRSTGALPRNEENESRGGDESPDKKQQKK